MFFLMKLFMGLLFHWPELFAKLHEVSDAGGMHPHETEHQEKAPRNAFYHTVQWVIDCDT